MQRSLCVAAPAKINLSLDITGRREDGYHFMRMVMQSVNLYDTIEIAASPFGQTLVTCDRDHIPEGEDNIAHRAARAFFSHTGISGGVSIHLIKAIPTEAGLAGGSADAAGVLVGLNAFFETGLSRETLCDIGQTVGADVPFCIIGGTCLVEGIGEIITELPSMPDCHILLAKPKVGAKTENSFARYDRLGTSVHPDTDEMLAAVVAGDLEAVAANAQNALEAICEVPEVGMIEQVMCSYGALSATMTGSGTCVFGLFDSRMRAKRCMHSLFDKAQSVFLTRPVAHGAHIL